MSKSSNTSAAQVATQVAATPDYSKDGTHTITITFTVKAGVVVVDNKAGAVYTDLKVARANKPSDDKQVLRTLCLGGALFHSYAVNGINNESRTIRALGGAASDTDKKVDKAAFAAAWAAMSAEERADFLAQAQQAS